MTRSAGTSGLTRAGSPPRSAIASRMTARSTIAGTPVKSWRITRAGMNGTSASAATPGRHAASVSTSSPRTIAAAGVAQGVLEQDLERDGGARRGRAGRRRRRAGSRSGRPGPSVARAPKGSIVGRRDATRPPSRRSRTLDAWKRTAVEAAAPLTRSQRRGEGLATTRSARRDGRRGATPRATTRIERLEAAGIDLDPLPPGHHRHGDDVHRRPRPSARPRGGRGAAGHRDRRCRRRRDGARRRADPGRLAGPRRRQPRRRAGASGSAGWSTARGRSPRRRPSSTRSSSSSWPSPTTRSRRRRGLRMYSGQAMVHTSGALGAEVLAPAMAAGTQVGVVPPARRVRRHGAGGRRAPRRDGRDRGRRPAGDAARRDGRGDRRGAGPARAGLEVGVPRGGGPRRRRLRRAARRDRRAGPRGRPRRGRRAGDLRAAHRADARQRPGARHPRRPDRADHPRRRRHAAGPPGRAARPMPPASLPCTAPPPSARSPSPRPVAR